MGVRIAFYSRCGKKERKKGGKDDAGTEARREQALD